MADDTAAGNSNQRVTNAVLALKIDNLDETVRAYIAADNRRYEDHEARLRTVETTQSGIRGQLKLITGAQAVLTLVASTIAGWLGTRA